MRAVYVTIALLAVALSGCSPTGEGGGLGVAPPALQGELERANQLAEMRSQAQIESYLRRHGLEGFTRDGHGLHLKVEGTPSVGDLEASSAVQVRYTLELLTGDTIRHMAVGSYETLVLGRADRTEGLDLVLLSMRPGQSAVALVPARLGYGLRGDGSRIGPNTPLLYRVHEVLLSKGGGPTSH